MYYPGHGIMPVMLVCAACQPWGFGPHAVLFQFAIARYHDFSVRVSLYLRTYEVHLRRSFPLFKKKRYLHFRCTFLLAHGPCIVNRTCAAARGGGTRHANGRRQKRLIIETTHEERRRRPGALRAPWNDPPMGGKGWGTLAALLARV